MKLYTIGFAGKTAEEFYGLLADHHVAQLVDIRVHPSGQLAGFASKRDLPYLLSRLVGPSCAYTHVPTLAPTSEMMRQYRADGDWPTYVEQFEELMDQRGVPRSTSGGAYRRLVMSALQ